MPTQIKSVGTRMINRFRVSPMTPIMPIVHKTLKTTMAKGTTMPRTPLATQKRIPIWMSRQMPKNKLASLFARSL